MSMAKDSGDHQANSNTMHQLKANDGIRGFGIFDHNGDLSLGLWTGTPDNKAMWKLFIEMMGKDAPEDIGYQDKGTLARGLRHVSLDLKKLETGYKPGLSGFMTRD